MIQSLQKIKTKLYFGGFSFNSKQVDFQNSIDWFMNNKLSMISSFMN